MWVAAPPALSLRWIRNGPHTLSGSGFKLADRLAKWFGDMCEMRDPKERLPNVVERRRK